MRGARAEARAPRPILDTIALSTSGMTTMRNTFLSLALAVACGPAFAAETPAPAAAPAPAAQPAHRYPSECSTEVSRYCTTSLDDVDRFNCLRSHMGDLSRRCKVKMREATAGQGPTPSSGADVGE